MSNENRKVNGPAAPASEVRPSTGDSRVASLERWLGGDDRAEAIGILREAGHAIPDDIDNIALAQAMINLAWEIWGVHTGNPATPAEADSEVILEPLGAVSDPKKDPPQDPSPSEQISGEQ